MCSMSRRKLFFFRIQFNSVRANTVICQFLNLLFFFFLSLRQQSVLTSSFSFSFSCNYFEKLNLNFNSLSFLLVPATWIDVCRTNGNLLAIGCNDRSIKIFDKRCYSSVRTFDRIHSGNFWVFVDHIFILTEFVEKYKIGLIVYDGTRMVTCWHLPVLKEQ